MFRDVLVVVDATPDAREALTQAIDLAQRERSRLTLITVERRRPASAYHGVAAALPHLIPAAQAEALSHVPADVPVTTVLATPPHRQALMSEIERGGHDLIVMGAHPRGGVAFGTLSNYLVRRSPAPVLVVQAAPSRARVITREETSRTRTRRWATRSRVA